MSVSSDTNVSLKIFKKLSKYKDLEIEVTKMWHLRTTTLPIVIGALGMVAKTSSNYVSQIPGARSLTVNKTTKNNTHGHRTYPTKSPVNVSVIYIYVFINIYIYMYVIYICNTKYIQ